MNNTSALNETVLDETTKKAWDIKDITDIQFLFSECQKTTSELITSWDLMPEDIYFRLLVITFGVLVIYQLFVSGSSKAGGMFKWILMGVLVVIVLIALGII